MLWAHTCELPEPWQWLGTGDLLLTDGYSFPADGIGQAAFIQQLASSGLSGLMLAEGLGAAPLTMEAAAAADALDFPVLQAAYEVPFVSVARAVAESNSHDISRRLHTLLRIYDMVRRNSAEESPGDGLIAQMADEIECDLSVLDLVSGRTLGLTSPWSTSACFARLVNSLPSVLGPCRPSVASRRTRCPPLFSRFVRAPTWPWSWLLDTTSSKPTWRCCNTWPRSPRSRWTEVWLLS